jgi:alpha-galactosidase
LRNAGDRPVCVTRCLARVAFPPGRYEFYSQASRWSRENQGAWQTLRVGQVTLRHAWGRTTEEATPYLALRAEGTGQGIAFHVLPRGNWVMHAGVVAEGGNEPHTVIEVGLADANLHRALRPGETLALPEALFQPVPCGEPHRGAPLLHRYALGGLFADAKPEPPVVYNTWFHEFEILDVRRLRAQLAAARDIGCEAFVVDAGWYGSGASNWWIEAGDWREKPGAAFRGRMRRFAEEVRSAGLGFGLWMEPERFGPGAPIRLHHPEWFVPVGGGSARLDLMRPDARAYLRAEIGRLVESYGLGWMKLDFNTVLDADASGAELSDYYATWYRILDDLRVSYPRTFFEGCSSGAMRGDLLSAARFDAHFLSDTVNPVDVLRISQGAWLRMPPGQIERWAVLRSAGQAVPAYGKRTEDSPATVLTPRGGSWDAAETVDLTFALLAAMPGVLGFSGDLAGFDAASRAVLRTGVAFHKRWRRFIRGAVAHLLTPPEPVERREGWIGVQLQDPRGGQSLVFVYRLGSCGAPPPMRLANLRSGTRYVLRGGFDETTAGRPLSGADLMSNGLPWPRCLPPGGLTNAAAVFSLQPFRTRH